jgi:hypothetical protein
MTTTPIPAVAGSMNICYEKNCFKNDPTDLTHAESFRIKSSKVSDGELKLTLVDGTTDDAPVVAALMITKESDKTLSGSYYSIHGFGGTIKVTRVQ